MEHEPQPQSQTSDLPLQVTDPDEFDRWLYPSLMAGNKEAWDQFYDHYAGRLERFFQRNGVYLEADREDLLQRSMETVFASLERYDPDQGPLRNWVYGVARNVLLRAQQKYSEQYAREQGGDEVLAFNATISDDWTITEPEVVSQSTALLQETLKRMHQIDQEIIGLRIGWEGATWRDLADELGIGESAAKMRYQRAVKRLTKTLGTQFNTGLSQPSLLR